MKYRNLDVLRAIAVSYVFVNHVTLEIFRSPELQQISGALGRFGVILFFIHTSLVLMQSIESLRRKSGKWIRAFYVRRAFRIYPLAIVTIFIAVCLHTPPAPWEGPASIPVNGVRAIILNVLLLQNIVRVPPVIGPLWTLPIEVQMYAVLPFVFMIFRFRNWRGLMTGLFVMSGIAAFVVYSFTGRLNLLAFTPCFLCGATAYKLRSTSTPSWSSAWWVPAILVVSTGGVIWTLKVPVEWCLCLVLALLFPRIKEVSDGWFSRSCHQIAKYSYGIYLSNLFACWISFNLLRLGNTSLQVMCALAITAVASVAAYHLIEDPFIEFGKRLSAHLGAARIRPIQVAQTAGPGNAA